MLTAIRDQFWKAGYTATSVSDLMRVTGLGKGSLYAAFGDKHRLFLRVLQDYVDTGHAALRRRLLTTPRAVDALHAYLTNPAAEGAERGCFMANSTSELATLDDDVRERSRQTYAERVRIVAEGVARAQEQGDLSLSLDPATLAAELVAAQQGIVFLGRAGMDIDQLRATATRLADRLIERIAA